MINVSFSERLPVKISLFSIFIYLTSSLIASKAAHCSYGEFFLFNAADNFSILINFLTPVIFLSGTVIVLFIPGILIVPLVIKRKIDIISLLIYGYVSNLVVLIFGGSLFKLFTKTALDRGSFIAVIFLVSLFFIIIVKVKDKAHQNRFVLNVNLVKIIIFSITVSFFSIAAYNYFDGAPFNVNLSKESLLKISLGEQADEFEIIGVTESLRTYLFPYWDLEYADKLGYHIIDPPLAYFLIFHFMLLFGNSCALYTIIALVCFVIMVMSSLNVPFLPNNSKSYFILLPFYLFFVIFITRVKSDFLLNFFTLIGLTNFYLHCYFITVKKYKISLIFAGLSFVMFYESLFFVAVGVICFYYLFKDEWDKMKNFAKNYMYFVIIYLCSMVVLGVVRGDLDTYFESLIIEKFMRFDHFGMLKRLYVEQKYIDWGKFSFYNMWIFLKNLLFASSFLSVILLFPQQDRVLRLLSYMGRTYFVVILFSSYQREHYVLPLVMISALIIPKYVKGMFFGLKRKIAGDKS